MRLSEREGDDAQVSTEWIDERCVEIVEGSGLGIVSALARRTKDICPGRHFVCRPCGTIKRT